MHTRRMKFFLFIIILPVVVFFASCNVILMNVAGIKSVHKYSEKELVQLSHEYAINTKVYALDTGYMNFAKQFKDSLTKKNLLQPLQIIFFNHGKAATHLINCTVGGFPNLKWNRYGTFDSLTNIHGPLLENELTLENLIHYIDPNPGIKEDKNICFVFWSNFMGRQSKNLIEYSKKRSVQDNYEVIYVNNDNFFYYWTVENKKK
jgi:hypothetical protein